LFVEDLLNAYDAAQKHIEQAAGKIYNIGGGINNTMSIWLEFRPRLEKLVGHPVEAQFGTWRPGDQRIYVSDIRKAQRELDWQPEVELEEGLQRLADWVLSNKQLFR
jgi:CDP-paratose 2-epimerase